VKVHTIHEAKTHLSQLIKEACEGEEVVIARGDKPVVKLVPIGIADRPRKPGRFAGKISRTADAFDPLTDEELREMGVE
jgi:prevent-host-death family protein